MTIIYLLEGGGGEQTKRQSLHPAKVDDQTGIKSRCL